MPVVPLKEGHYIRFVGSNVPGGLKEYSVGNPKFYRIGPIEGYEYITGNTDTAEFTAVASGSQSGFKNIAVLEPDDRPMHLFLNMHGCKDGSSYQIKVPSGSDRLGTDVDKDVARINNEKSPWCDMNPLFAFYTVHDQYPAANVYNNTPGSFTPEIHFRGEKYEFEEVTDDEIIKRLRNYESRETPFLKYSKITLGGVQT